MTEKCMSKIMLKLATSIPQPVKHLLAHTNLMRPVTRKLYEALIGVSASEVICLPHLGGLKMRINTQIFKSYVLGTYEPAVFKVIQQTVRRGDQVLDVGAHLGYFALLLAKQVGNEGKVWAFEPAPEVATTLQENIEMNCLSSYVRVERVAVTDYSGSAQLHLTDNPLGAADSLVGGLADLDKTEMVKCVSLDDFFLSQGLSRLDFIMIDVEGAEGLVLKGANSILRSFRPIVLVEMHTLKGSTYEAAEDLLKSLGYVLESIDREHGKIANHVLCTPQDRRSL